MGDYKYISLISSGLMGDPGMSSRASLSFSPKALKALERSWGEEFADYSTFRRFSDDQFDSMQSPFRPTRMFWH